MLRCMKLQASLPSAGEFCSLSSFVPLVVVVVLPCHWEKMPLVVVVVSSWPGSSLQLSSPLDLSPLALWLALALGGSSPPSEERKFSKVLASNLC